MKKVFFLLLTTLFLSATGFCQELDKEVMVKKVFTLLKNNDKKGYITLFPNAALTKEFLFKMMDADTSMGKQERNTMMESFLDKINDSDLKKNYAKEYDRVTKMAANKAVNFSKATYVSHTLDSTYKEEGGIRASKLAGKIYFTQNGKDYFLKYDNIIWFENKGWFGVSIDYIDLKEKENEDEEHAGVLLPDTAMVAVDTAAIAPPKPIKKITPSKPKGNTTKPKLKTAARKPE